MTLAIILIFIVVLLSALFLFTLIYPRPIDNRIIYWNTKKLEDIQVNSATPETAAKELIYFHSRLKSAIEDPDNDINQIARDIMSTPVESSHIDWKPDIDTRLGEWELGKGTITTTGMWNLIAGSSMEATRMSEPEMNNVFIALNDAIANGTETPKDILSRMIGTNIRYTIDYNGVKGEYIGFKF